MNEGNHAASEITVETMIKARDTLIKDIGKVDDRMYDHITGEVVSFSEFSKRTWGRFYSDNKIKKEARE